MATPTNIQKYFSKRTLLAEKKHKQKSQFFWNLWRTEKTMSMLYTLEVSDYVFVCERKLHYNLQQI